MFQRLLKSNNSLSYLYLYAHNVRDVFKYERDYLHTIDWTKDKDVSMIKLNVFQNTFHCKFCLK